MRFRVVMDFEAPDQRTAEACGEVTRIFFAGYLRNQGRVADPKITYHGVRVVPDARPAPSG
jgi:hypothetical protein